MNQDFPIQVIDNVIPSNLAQTYQDIILSHFKYSYLGGGTTALSQNFIIENKLNNMFEQPQFSFSLINDDGTWNIEDWHLMSLPLTLTSLILSTTYKIDQVVKCKINLQTKAPLIAKGKYNFPHTDISGNKENIITILYYVNDSDGDTYLFDKHQYDGSRAYSLDYYKELKIIKKISPKMGRIVLFNASQVHAGSHPVDNDIRCVINYNCKLSPFTNYPDKERNATSALIKYS